MRWLLFLAVALSWTAPALAETLITPSFVVVIIRNDPEGVVTSDNVTYVGVSRKNGNTLKLKGSTQHTLATDGETPARFLGYLFKNDNVTYLVSTDGTLKVSKGTKVILEETGEWAY